MLNITVESTRPTEPDYFSCIEAGESCIVVCYTNGRFTPSVDLVRRLAARGRLEVELLGAGKFPDPVGFSMGGVEGVMLELKIRLGDESSDELDAVLRRLSRIIGDYKSVGNVLLEVERARSDG